MRDNGPVTQRNRDVPADTYLVSRTDTRGVVTYANRPFIAISGFSRDQLIGQPHNILRHPDMPPAAFADMWATLKSGKGWVGVVKNRCANGDHYWVRAAVSPEIGPDGKISGFVSVRVRPTAAEIDGAERAYARIREGDRNLSVKAGRVRVRGFIPLCGRVFSGLSVRIALAFLVLVTLVGTTAWLGIHSDRQSHQRLVDLYEGPLVRTHRLGTVAALTRDNWSLLHKAAEGKDPAGVGVAVSANRTRIDQELQALAEAVKGGPNEEALRNFIDHRAAFVDTVIKPALAAISAGRTGDIAGLLTVANDERLADINHEAEELMVGLGRAAKASITDGEAHVRFEIVELSLVGAAAIGFAIITALALIGRLRRGLHGIEVPILAMTNGRLDTQLELDRTDEFGALQSELAILQTRLGYSELRGRESRADLVEDFDRSLGEVLGNLDHRLKDLHQTAASQGSVAQEVAGSAQSVSTSATELSASIREIANQASNASQLAHQCAQQTRSGVENMQRLAKAADEISGVAKLIGKIADKTNLLALNATIEAASAGEAGRGFAVVAGEVKALASQTGNATGNIGQQIAAVLADTRDADIALRAIAESVERLTTAANAIAAAVEEQSAVVDEVARGAAQSSSAASATDEAARAVAASSAALADGNRSLIEAAGKFKAGLGA